MPKKPMKPLFFLLISSALIASVLIAQPVRLSVDASVVVGDINPLLFGINTARWDESLFPGSSTEMLLSSDRDAIAKIKASGITMLKYPGGNDADHYVWNSPANNASEMDTDEYLALCRETGAEPFITVNFNEPPELAADWVRYCNVTRGFGVKLWEVGDEQWGSWAKGHSSPEEYARKFSRFARAMKAVDPSIKIATNVALAGSSASLGGASEGWTARVLRAASDDIDMLTITFYPQQWGEEDDDVLLASVDTYRTLFQRLKAEVERVVGREKAAEMLFVNVGYNSVNHSPGPQTLTMTNALWIADMLGAMAETETDIACYWAVHNYFPPRNGDYGYLSSEGSNTPRLSYYVFPMFRNHFSGSLLKVNGGDSLLQVYASTNGKRLTFMIVNKSKSRDREISFTLRSFDPHPVASAWLLNEKRHNERLPDVPVDGSTFTSVVPPFSLVALELLRRDSVQPPINIARLATPTASSFSTIGPHFGPTSAIDGKAYTRWNTAAWTKSNGKEAQWFQLEWPAPQRFSTVRIRWGEARAVAYTLEISSDGVAWRTVHQVARGTEETDEVHLQRVEGRFLRMNGTEGTGGRTTISTYSIREFEVE